MQKPLLGSNKFYFYNFGSCQVRKKMTYLSVLESIRKARDQNGRQLARLFSVLPSKFDYPDYYEIIQEPISLKEIRSRIERGKYETDEEFRSDLDLMFQNCRTYNMPGSEVYEDSLILENIVENHFKKKIPKITIKPFPPPEEEEEEPELKKRKVEKRVKQDEGRLLMSAIEKGNLKQAKQILDSSNSTIATTLHDAPLELFGAEFQWAAVHMAAYYGRTDILRILMDLGAEVNLKDTWYNGTPLSWAVFGAQYESAKMLISDFNADRTVRNTAGQGLLELVSDPDVSRWTELLSEVPLKIRVRNHPIDLRSKMMNVLLLIYNAADKSGRSLSAIFHELPSKMDYPDYYESISNPISLQEIKESIQNTDITLTDFRKLIATMCLNAMEYNEDGSIIFKDAIAIHEIFKREIRKCEEIFLKTLEETTINNQILKIGDFVLLVDSSVLLIEKIGENDSVYVSGTWFLTHEFARSNSYYPNEVFKSDLITIPVNQILRKCAVIWAKDFHRGLPKDFDLDSIFICEFRLTSRSVAAIKDWTKEFIFLNQIELKEHEFPVALKKGEPHSLQKFFLDARRDYAKIKELQEEKKREILMNVHRIGFLRPDEYKVLKNEEPIKRKRGRPRKDQSINETQMAAMEVDERGKAVLVPAQQTPLCTPGPRLVQEVIVEMPGFKKNLLFDKTVYNHSLSVPASASQVRLIPQAPVLDSLDPYPFGIAVLRAGKHVYPIFTTLEKSYPGPIFDCDLLPGVNIFEVWTTAQKIGESKQMQQSNICVLRA